MVDSLFIQALETILLLYVTPETNDNLELRQCLSYFFPVYCYSSSENQRKMKEASRSVDPFGLSYLQISCFCPCLPRSRRCTPGLTRVRRWSAHSNLLRCSSTGWTQKRLCMCYYPIFVHTCSQLEQRGAWSQEGWPNSYRSRRGYRQGTV